MKLTCLALLLLVHSTRCESGNETSEDSTAAPSVRATPTMDEIHWEGEILCHKKPFGATVQIWESDDIRDDLLASSSFPDGQYSLVGMEDENGIEPYLYIIVDCATAPAELKEHRSNCIFQTPYIFAGGATAKTATKVTQSFELCEYPFGSIFQTIEVL